MSTQNLVYWLALHAAFGGTAAAGELLRLKLNIEPLLEGDPALLEKAGEISSDLAGRLRQAQRLLAQGASVAGICRNMGWTVLTPYSRCYPKAFLKLKDPPLALFAAGDPEWLLYGQTAAVVGTRRPEKSALIAAYRLAQAFSENGIVTVSGGALGIDSAAHEGALSGPGATVAVLGNGFGHNYLPEKAFMRRRIQARGALITELMPFAAPTMATFPRRNRLIAALGQTLTVAQSGEKGGSMISAAYAKSYGRARFAFSDALCPSAGCEKLIAEGAAPVSDAADVLAFYGKAKVSVPLSDDGAELPPILDPKACSPEQFAVLSGANLEEALPLYNMLLARPEEARVRPNPAPKPAQPAKLPLEAVALKQKIADAQGLTGDTRAVFLALEETPLGLDDLAALASLTPPQAMTAVTMLELADLAETLPGDRVKLRIRN